MAIHPGENGLRPRAATEPTQPRVGALDRLAGAGLTGLAAGAGMYLTLASFALSQGRGITYPLHAVQAMMSGRRVLPDHPVATVNGARPGDWVLGPVYFFLPAVVVALAVSYWVSRRGRDGSRPAGSHQPSAVLVPATVVAGVTFVVLVLLIGWKEAGPALQRVSSGYGVRQLGLPAWLLALAVYVLLVTLLLDRLARAVAAARAPKETTTLRGERREDPPSGQHRAELSEHITDGRNPEMDDVRRSWRT